MMRIGKTILFSTLLFAFAVLASAQVSSTPAGRQVLAWQKAQDSGERTIIQDFLTKNMPFGGVEQMLATHNESGGYGVKRVLESTATHLVVLAQERGGAQQFVRMPIAASVVHGAPVQGEKLSFEVVSIKPWKLTNATERERQLLEHGMDPFDGKMNPNGRFTATAVTLKRLISWAYNIPPERIQGGDTWINSDRFNVEAKAADGVMRSGEVSRRYEQLHLMLQSLLSERFGLKMQTAPKEFPVYALVKAKNGPRLQKADRDCSSPLTGSEVLCHGFTGGGPRVGQTGQSITMGELADFLSSHLDRPVVDQTDIKGVFDLKFPPWNPYLQGVPEGATQNGISREGKAADFNTVPTLFTLLEQQFGLKLEGSRAKIDTLVIDSAQSPTEN